MAARYSVSPMSFIRAGGAAERAMLTIVRRSSPRSFSTTTRLLNSSLPTVGSPARRTVPIYAKTLRQDFERRSQQQPFSTSASRRATVVTLNPRQDEEGNDMTIEITAGAAKRLREIATKDKNPDLALRVRVESGGCHGFQYLMSLTNKKDFNAEDDTVFETEDHQARVVMDEPSLELLKGSKVDFTMELIGSQFKITGNPAASSSCGCGTSFDIKM